MKTIKMFKMPFESRLFKKGQKVWIRNLTGAQACEVYARHRGSGRYIVAWVNWSRANKPNPVIKEIDVTDGFYKRVFK